MNFPDTEEFRMTLTFSLAFLLLILYGAGIVIWVAVRNYLEKRRLEDENH